MKRYDVLEAHLGDKQYLANDTRIADPNAVQHLVTLGILREAEDQAGIFEPVPSADPLADLRAQVEARDDYLATELEKLGYPRNGGPEDANPAEKAIFALTGVSVERDELRDQLVAAGADLAAMTTERDAARAEVETLRAAAKPDEGGDDPLARQPRRKSN